MPITEDQYKRLTSYLNNQLPSQEEERFIRDLNESEDLQREYDFELILRESLKIGEIEEENIVHPDFEEAEIHLQKVEKLFRSPVSQETRREAGAKVLHLPSIRITAIAACFLAIILVMLFYFQDGRKQILSGLQPRIDTTLVKSKDSGTSSPVRPDTVANRSLLAENSTGLKTYRKYYSRYQGGDDDPIEASRYLNAYYYDRDYAAVLQASETDLQTKGAYDNTAGSYLRFYKALSLLETDKNDQSIRQLTALKQHMDVHSELYRSVQWYLAMAYLKNGDVTQARLVLQEIKGMKGHSNYRTSAQQVLESLG